MLSIFSGFSMARWPAVGGISASHPIPFAASTSSLSLIYRMDIDSADGQTAIGSGVPRKLQIPLRKFVRHFFRPGRQSDVGLGRKRAPICVWAARTFG